MHAHMRVAKCPAVWHAMPPSAHFRLQRCFSSRTTSPKCSLELCKSHCARQGSQWCHGTWQTCTAAAARQVTAEHRQLLKQEPGQAQPSQLTLSGASSPLSIDSNFPLAMRDSRR